MEDTIVAISTTLGVGAISIIRVSGSEAIDLVNKITKTDLTKKQTHTINYDYILDNNKKIDEVMVSIMKAPKSFTKEDVVEINCHGGIATTNKILELLIEKGCRLAEPGEFTKRAFLNGRIDLVEAEGVMDVISAKTEKSLSLALSSLNGESSKLIRQLREELISIISNIEVNIDYPEYYDIKEICNKDILPKLNNIEKQINDIIVNYKDASIIKDGIKTIIIGKPNVGKSSLLNKLLSEEKAIVTDIPGTTRDIVEGEIYIDGIKLNIIDTAGIRKTNDIIENIGVEKSLKLIDEAELIIFVLNNNEIITKEEQELLNKIKNKNYIVVINKDDLEKKLSLKEEKAIYISTIENRGIKELKNEIKKMFNLDKIDTKDMTYISSSRSIGILKETNFIINQITEAINNNMPIDMIEIDLKQIWNKLGEIIGETYDEELLDQLFSRFCLGK
jgi:tRNA modification GTPase